MSQPAPAAVQTRLLKVLHRAFVQARNRTLAGDRGQLYELADTFEVLPELMTRWDETTLTRIQGVLAEYEANHPRCGYEYLSLLDEEEKALLPNNDFHVETDGESANPASRAG